MALEVRNLHPDDDLASLAAVARVPIQLGDAQLVIDWGSDYSAAYALMESRTVVVAELDGRLVGVSCGALRDVLIGGERKKLLLLHHVRIAPEARGLRLFGAMQGRVFDELGDRAEGGTTYIHPDNAAARRLTVVDAWSVLVQRALLPCAELAGPPAGRPATAGDAAAIVSMLNQFHGGEELYLPWDAQRWLARVSRVPALYGVDDVVLNEAAVVGISRAIERRHLAGQGEERHTVRATVLDYGCLPGGEEALVALLRDRCRVAAERGCTHLAVFTSETSPSWQVLQGLAGEFEPYEVRTNENEEPEGAARHGVYTDPVYF